MEYMHGVSDSNGLSELEQTCVKKGLKLTVQRRLILNILEKSKDHPDIDEVYRRVNKHDASISIATVYRTIRLLHDTAIIDRHAFKHDKLGKRSRYELNNNEKHDHIIVVDSGEIIDFNNTELNRLREIVAKKMGYKLVDAKLELYVSKGK